MPRVTMTRRRFAQTLLTGLGSVVAVMASGCVPTIPAAPAIVAAVKVFLAWVGLIAVTGYLVLRAAEKYWHVESARLDVERKELELEGVREGQRIKGIMPLDAQQVAAIQEHKKVRIEFNDGQAIELPVTV